MRNAPRVWEGTKENYNTPVDKLEETKERVKKVQTLNVDDKKVRHIQFQKFPKNLSIKKDRTNSPTEEPILS